MSFAHETDGLSNRVIGLALNVHPHLGPGLLESAYEECLCWELREAKLPHRRQVALPVVYQSVRLDCGYRMDLVIDDQLVIKIKAVERLLPLREAQMLTYLRLSGFRAGLLMNFNTVALRDGLRRLVL
jgi:GxxExxY protein